MPNVLAPAVAASSSWVVESAYTASKLATLVGAVPSLRQLAPPVPKVVHPEAPTDNPPLVGSAITPAALNVEVVDGVCEACDPAPVMSAVLVNDAALVTQVAQPMAPAAEIVTGDVPLRPDVPTLPMGMAVGRSPVAIARKAGAPAVANKA